MADESQQLLKIDLGNYDEILKDLEQFDALDRRVALNKIVREAVKPVVKAARAEVPQPGYPGDKKGFKPLKKTIGVTLKEYPGIAFATVGPKWPAGAHGHNVHFGHRIVTGGTGWNTRRTNYRRNGVIVFSSPRSYAKVSKRTGERGRGSVSGRTRENRYMDRAIAIAGGRVSANLEEAITKVINKMWEGKSSIVQFPAPAATNDLAEAA